MMMPAAENRLESSPIERVVVVIVAPVSGYLSMLLLSLCPSSPLLSSPLLSFHGKREKERERERERVWTIAVLHDAGGESNESSRVQSRE